MEVEKSIQVSPTKGEEFFQEVLFQYYLTLQGSKNFLPKKQAKQNKTKPFKHSVFVPLRIEAISIVETLPLRIYVLSVPLGRGQASCA